jgi:hypothetical protein
MEERMRASIDKLPAAQKAEALAEMDERKKFFSEMSGLTPEERRQKMAERMEQDQNNDARAQRFENNMTKRGAMQTASQRSEGAKRYLDRKRSQ